MPTRDLLRALFVDRTHHIRLHVHHEDSDHGARIGGRPPEVLAQRPIACPVCGKPTRYFLTVETDVLGRDICPSGALSIFHCTDIECLVQGWHFRDPSPLVCVPHRRSPRASTPGPLDSPIEGRSIVAGDLYRDRARFGTHEQASKVGGRPGLVQDEGEEEIRKLESSHLFFLFQFNEEDYPRDMRIDGHPFRNGTLYVFCHGREGVLPKDFGQCAAFWEAP